MKKMVLGLVLVVVMCSSGFGEEPNKPADKIGKSVSNYFDKVFAGLKAVADQEPTVDTFRSAMKSFAEGTDGFYGGTLVDPNFVIIQVYYKTHFLAKGFDLNKVDELKDFWKKMKADPQPQLSEPAHGSIMQPRLIAMRYPMVKGKKLVGIVSAMVRTEKFLSATGLDKCRAYRITCLGKMAEEKGLLSKEHKKVTLTLPSTSWVIEYDE
ncbi:MAG: hypothetical protein A2178_02785 [Planctomycetes bacterium GWC2_49_10]|nr:MAG: hypothetical protein A2178_02785 [Planctomycetes bacterium GWC2_49_10]